MRRRWKDLGAARRRRRANPLGLVLMLGAFVVPARAGSAPAPTLSIGALGGIQKPDGDLADYQWGTLPQGAWGAQATVGLGRFEAGPRLWKSQSSQRIDETTTASVHSTSWGLVGRGRVAEVGGGRLSLLGSAGRLHLGYHPDRVTLDAGGTPVAIDLGPIDEWIAGAGLAFQRRIASRWDAGLEVEQRLFRLDTAHRDGGTIVQRRRSFGEWNARVELARVFFLR